MGRIADMAVLAGRRAGGGDNGKSSRRASVNTRSTATAVLQPAATSRSSVSSNKSAVRANAVNMPAINSRSVNSSNNRRKAIVGLSARPNTVRTNARPTKSSTKRKKTISNLSVRSNAFTRGNRAINSRTVNSSKNRRNAISGLSARPNQNNARTATSSARSASPAAVTSLVNKLRNRVNRTRAELERMKAGGENRRVIEETRAQLQAEFRSLEQALGHNTTRNIASSPVLSYRERIKAMKVPSINSRSVNSSNKRRNAIAGMSARPNNNKNTTSRATNISTNNFEVVLANSRAPNVNDNTNVKANNPANNNGLSNRPMPSTNNRVNSIQQLCGVSGNIVSKKGFLPKMPLNDAFRRKFADIMLDVIRPQLARLRVIRQQQGSACGHVVFDGTCAPHQLGMFALARLFAESHPNQLGGHRGLLVWHGTGQGKTLISAAIMVAFARNNHHVILATPKGNLDNNTPYKYAEYMIKFFPGFLRSYAQTHNLSWSNAVGQNMTKNQVSSLASKVQDALFSLNVSGSTKPFSIYTMDRFQNNVAGRAGGGVYKVHQKRYAHLAELMRNGERYENGTVLIIDEAQNVFHSRHSRLADKLLSPSVVNAGSGNRNAPPGPFGVGKPVKVFALTATPGNSIAEWLQMLSLVRPAGQPVFQTTDNLPKFMSLFSHISYKDPVHFAILKGPYDVRVGLPPLYYAALLRARKSAKDDMRRPEQYMRSIKQSGNFLTKTDCGVLWDAFAAVVPKASASASNNARVFKDKEMVILEVGGYQKVVGPKLLELAARLLAPGKHYVYTQSKSSAKVIAALLGAQGWSKISVRDKRPRERNGRIVEGGWVNDWMARNGKTINPKRFVVYDKGGSTTKAFDNIRDLFNARENVNGALCKVIIAFGKSYEGVDVNALRAVHLVEPLYSTQADMQAVGRGARYCGHAWLNGVDRTVAVYRYFAVAPRSFSHDNFNTVWGHKKGKRSKLYQAKMKNLVNNHRNLQNNAIFRKMNNAQRLATVSLPKGYDNVAHVRAQVYTSDLRRFEDAIKPYSIDRLLWDKADEYRR